MLVSSCFCTTQGSPLVSLGMLRTWRIYFLPKTHWTLLARVLILTARLCAGSDGPKPLRCYRFVSWMLNMLDMQPDGGRTQELLEGPNPRDQRL